MKLVPCLLSFIVAIDVPAAPDNVGVVREVTAALLTATLSSSMKFILDQTFIKMT